MDSPIGFCINTAAPSGNCFKIEAVADAGTAISKTASFFFAISTNSGIVDATSGISNCFATSFALSSFKS